MKQVNRKNSIPLWLDSETRVLIKDVIEMLSERHPDLVTVILYGSVARHEERPLDASDPSDVDLLVILDSDDPHVALNQGDALFHTLGLVYTAPPERSTRGSGDVFLTYFARIGTNIHSKRGA